MNIRLYYISQATSHVWEKLSVSLRNFFSLPPMLQLLAGSLTEDCTVLAVITGLEEKLPPVCGAYYRVWCRPMIGFVMISLQRRAV